MSQTIPSDSAKPGVRPVPARTCGKVLTAAKMLLASRGYADTTIEGIAAEAGVAKTTIYRWWPSKAALLLDLFETGAGEAISRPDTGDVTDDLKVYFRDLQRLVDGTVIGLAAAGLAAEAEQDPAMKDEICRRFTAFRRDGLGAILERAIANGQVRGDVDRELLDDIVVGPFWYRLLVAHEPFPAGYGDQLVETVLGGLRA